MQPTLGLVAEWIIREIGEMMMSGQTVKLKVVGDNTIHCAGCEGTVEFTLSRIPGVEKVKADHKTQDIEFVLTSGETDLEKVKDGLEWIGYEVEVK